LTWIQGAKCLGAGEAPVLPGRVYEKWQSAFRSMNDKLKLLQTRVTKLDEWKFTTVETIYLRLDSLIRQGIPTEIAETITTMKSKLSDALEAKAAMLNDDLRKALDSGHYLTVTSIFREVKTANDNDSNFVNGEDYSSLINVLERFLDNLDKLIQNHYSNFEIKDAEIKNKDLKHLEMTDKVQKHVDRENLHALAILKKKAMISRPGSGRGI